MKTKELEERYSNLAKASWEAFKKGEDRTEIHAEMREISILMVKEMRKSL